MMQVSVHGHELYAYTGGKPFNPAQPTIVLIHGVLNDHSVWALQSRHLANHGWNVLAIDLPGHSRSKGTAPASVEEAAEAIIALLDALGIERAALAGHSWGSLIALEAASRLGTRVSHLILIGTAAPMKVSPALLEMSQNAPEKAMHLVNVFSRNTLAAPPSGLGPGTWVYGLGMALNRRVLRSNPHENVFHKGFTACDRYSDAATAITQVKAPVLFILGTHDQMTPAKSGQALARIAQDAGVSVRVEQLNVGHNLMTEAPEETLKAIHAGLNAAA